MCNYKDHGNIYVKWISGELLLDGSPVRGSAVDNCAGAGVGVALYLYTDYAQYCWEMSDRYWELEDPDVWDFERYAVRLLSWRPSLAWAGYTLQAGERLPDDVYYY